MIRYVFLFIAVIFFSCQGDEKTFTREENKIIDSLYRIKIKELRPKLDTVCDSVYDLTFPVFVDSIKKVRQKEIIDLIQN